MRIISIAILTLRPGLSPASGEEQTPNVYNSYTNEIKYPLWIVTHSVEEEFVKIVRDSTSLSVVA